MSYRADDEEKHNHRRGDSWEKSAADLPYTPADEQLKAQLALWTVGEPSRTLDERVLENYRRHSVPFWKRAFVSSVRVPVPVAAAAVLLLLALSFLAVRPVRSSAPQPSADEAPAKVSAVDTPAEREQVASSPVNIEKGNHRRVRSIQQKRRKYTARRTDNGKATAQEGLSGHVFTRGDLSGFQPVGQMRIEVIRGTKTNED